MTWIAPSRKQHVAVTSFVLGICASIGAQTPPIREASELEFDPRNYDIVAVHLTSADNENEADAFADGLAALVGQYSGESIFSTSRASYFKFTSREQLGDFLDATDSTAALPGNSNYRIRDVIVWAEVLKAGCVEDATYVSPNDFYFSGQDSFQLHEIEQGWNKMPTSLAQVKIAVIDSGIESNHADLAGRIAAGGRNFTNQGGATNVSDSTGHGTHVSGIIAAIAGNSIGIAGCEPTNPGLPPVIQVLPLKLWKSANDPTVNPEMVAEAIDYAVAQGADVINMSFSLSDDSFSLNDAIDDAVDHRVVLVGSAGNSDQSDTIDGQYLPTATTVKPPNDDPSVITVGGLRGHSSPNDFYNYKSPTSTWGNNVDVMAYGFNVVSTQNTGYANLSGTSQAAPHVAALAGLIKSFLPLASTKLVKNLILMNTLPTNGNYGAGTPKTSAYGRVSFEDAIDDALDSVPNLPLCPAVPLDSVQGIMGLKPFKENYAIWVSGQSPPGGIPVNLKHQPDQCNAVTHAAYASDTLYFLAISKTHKKKQQVAFRTSCYATGVPTSKLSLRLRGTVAAPDDIAREIAVRFWNYSKKEWGKPIVKTPAPDVAFDQKFSITSNMMQHIKSPQGAVRCNIQVRPSVSSSNTVEFGLYLDEVTLVVE